MMFGKLMPFGSTCGEKSSWKDVQHNGASIEIHINQPNNNLSVQLESPSQVTVHKILHASTFTSKEKKYFQLHTLI